MDLLEGLYNAVTHFEEEDKIGWKWEKGEDYSVKSCYAILAKYKADLAPQPHERVVNFPLIESGANT